MSEQKSGTTTAPTTPVTAASANDSDFNDDLIKKYPRSNRKMTLEVEAFGLIADSSNQEASQSLHISPYGIEFHATKEYAEGALLKIHVAMPEYWNLKQKFVDYRRVDAPAKMKILAKVVKSQEVGKRGKKRVITVQTVNMDEIDEQVLKLFLQEG